MIQDKVGNLLLSKRASKLKRNILVNNLKTAKTAGVLYNASQKEHLQHIKDFCSFLESQKIETQSMGFYGLKDTEEKPISSLNHEYFDKKEINLMKIPKGNTVKTFMDKEFDLLIDCNLSGQFSLKYISSLSRAKFKVGPSGGYHQKACDLLIAMKEPFQLNEFLEQTKHYLKIINNA